MKSITDRLILRVRTGYSEINKIMGAQDLDDFFILIIQIIYTDGKNV